MPDFDPELLRACRFLYDTSPDAVAVTAGPLIAYANEACRKLYGYDDEGDYVGKPFLAMVAPHAHELAVELVRRRAAGEHVPGVYQLPCLRRDGTEFTCELRTTVAMRDGQMYITVLQREVEAQIEVPDHDEAFYKAVFNDNPAIKLLIDPATGAIVDANEAAVAFYGFDYEQLRKMRITEINQLSASEVREEMRNAQTGRRRYFRFRHKIASGEIRHVEVHSGPISVGVRQVLLSIIHDVTDRDALAEQLRASQHLEAVGRLAGGIAHEFNNLLTVVLNGSAMLLRTLRGDDRLRRYLEDMSFASERAADLTRDLLAFSRRQVMDPVALNLNAVVERMAGMLQRSIGSSVTISTQLAPDLPATMSDPRQLEHVLMNLVLNARDAMPQGGGILVQTSMARTPDDDASIPPGRWAKLIVRDEGVGMDEETRRHLFEPFFTTKADGHGTGLGMATVYGIIKQTGGHIRVESERGQGSTIAVYLPLSATNAREGDDEDLAPRLDATVLLVEDRQMVRRALRRALEDVGAVVHDASSAAAARRVWAEEHAAIDVLVTDIVLPDESGVQLAEALIAERTDLPVLVLSGDLRGHDLSSLPRRVRKLQKPVTAERLAAELAELLQAASDPSPA